MHLYLLVLRNSCQYTQVIIIKDYSHIITMLHKKMMLLTQSFNNKKNVSIFNQIVFFNVDVSLWRINNNFLYHILFLKRNSRYFIAWSVSFQLYLWIYIWLNKEELAEKCYYKFMIRFASLRCQKLSFLKSPSLFLFFRFRFWECLWVIVLFSTIFPQNCMKNWQIQGNFGFHRHILANASPKLSTGSRFAP